MANDQDKRSTYPLGIELTSQNEGNKVVLVPERNRNYAWIVILVIFLLVMPLVLGLFVIRSRTVFVGQASGVSDTKVQVDNSYLFASPLKAKSGGEMIRVTVFVLNSQGKGLSGKTVQLGVNENLVIDMIHPLTDELGRAYFDISSHDSGVYSIEAVVDGVTLSQKVTIAFE